MDFPALSLDDPKTQGILALAMGLMKAGGPSPYPVPLGAALGQGGAAGLNQYTTARQAAQNYELENQKIALTGLQAAHLQYQAALQAWAAGGGKGPPPAPPAFNFPGMPKPTAPATMPPAQPQAAAGPTPPGMSPATSTLAFGTPEFASGPTQPNQPAEQDNGLFAGLPDYARKAIVSNIAMPGSGEIIMKANQPIPMRQGPLVSPTGQMIFQNTPPVPGVNFNYGAQGRVTSAEPISGFAPTVAGIEAAKAGAKASAEATQRTVEVTTPDGRKVRVPESSITGGPAMQPTAPSRPTPFTPPRQAPNLSQGITPAEAEAQRANEEMLAHEASKGREAANLAVDTNYNLQHVLEAANGFDTGKFAPTVAGARAFLQGALPDLFPKEQMDKLTSFQEFSKYSIRLGFDQARKMGARESTQIVEMSIKSNPNPEMVKPAITSIANGLMAQNDYVIAKEKARDAYLAQNKKHHE